MDFIESVILTRASVRSFTGQAVSKDLLTRIARAGMAAPSAVNVQPWELVVVTSRETLDALCRNLPYAKMLDKAGAAFVVCGNPAKDAVAKLHWVEDCSAVTENILLAVHSLGLGAVWTAVHPDQARVAAVRKILGIPETIVPLNVIPVGVIGGNAPAPKDKFNPKALHFDRW